jgi:hypothetical protein
MQEIKMAINGRSLKYFFAAVAVAAPLALGGQAYAQSSEAEASQPGVSVSQEAAGQNAEREAATSPAAGGFNSAAGQSDSPAGPSASAVSAPGGGVSYISPWLLMAGLGLPLLWWLLRVTPPAPRTQEFPGTRLLKKIDPKEETPDKTPWWLLQLRMTAAAMVIAGLAGPLIDPEEAGVEGNDPMLLVIDNGWASASHWSARMKALDEYIDKAEQRGRKVIFLKTAPEQQGQEIQLSEPMHPQAARDYIKSITPRPWPVDRNAALNALQNLDSDMAGNSVWFSNSLQGGNVEEFVKTLEKFGGLTVMEDTLSDVPKLLVPPSDQDRELRVPVKRAATGLAEELEVVASDVNGNVLARSSVSFGNSDDIAYASFVDLDASARNRIATIKIASENNAGAVVLFDESWRRRPVGIVESSRADIVHPLLDSSDFVEKALSPYVENIYRGDVNETILNNPAVLVLTDSAMLTENDVAALSRWVEQGGTILRFAGPNLDHKKDELLPVRLRDGVRDLSATLSSQPGRGRIAEFEPGSPFYGLKVPVDVVINKQLLAQPDHELNQKTWARLEDGTPLVTSERRGEGQIVFVHTTADTQWSTLSVSGLFIDMLRSVISYSQGVVDNNALDNDGKLQPWKTLDSSGRLSAPQLSTKSLDLGGDGAALVSPENPPGFYGSESFMKAHNLGSAQAEHKLFSGFSDSVNRREYGSDKETNLMKYLISGAFLFIFADLLVAMGRGGVFPSSGNRPGQRANRGAASKPRARPT